MIGVIVVTQMRIASELVRTAARITDESAGVIAVDLLPEEGLQEQSRRVLEAVARSSAEAGEPAEGILVLIDLFGGTPANAALLKIAEAGKPVQILTGVNLPMLVSALVHRRRMDLAALAQKAAADGQKGIREARAGQLAPPKA